jgi:hypothetical protein
MTVSRILGLALLFPLALAACEREKATPGAPARVTDAAPPAPVAVPPSWFLCDALNAPMVLVVSHPDASKSVTILTIDKADLHPPVAALYALGDQDPGAGSVNQTLSRDGSEVGFVKWVNPGMLPKPEEATTPAVLTMKLDETLYSCRWLARTRLFGVAAGRTVLVTDADDGPLLRTFDFKAPPGYRVMPDGAQRSSAPTLRIAGGTLKGDAYVFANEGYGFTVDPAGVAVTQDGRATSKEPFIAVQLAGR